MIYILALRDVLGAWWHYPIGDRVDPIAVYRAALAGRRQQQRRGAA